MGGESAGRGKWLVVAHAAALRTRAVPTWAVEASTLD